MRSYWIQTSFQLNSKCIQHFTLILPQSLLILHPNTTALPKTHCVHTRKLPCPYHILALLTLLTVRWIYRQRFFSAAFVSFSALNFLTRSQPRLNDRFTMLLQSDVVKSGTFKTNRNHVSLFKECYGCSPFLLSYGSGSHQLSSFGRPCSPRTETLNVAQSILPLAAQWHERYSAEHCS
jgi:hypothetical protein